MQLLVLTAAASLLTSAAAFTPASTSGTDALYAKGLVNLAEYEEANPPTSNCSLETGYVRKEWCVKFFGEAFRSTFVNSQVGAT